MSNQIKDKDDGVPQSVDPEITTKLSDSDIESARELDTSPHSSAAREIIAFEQGWAAARHVTISDFLDEFRISLIQGGNDPGLAYQLAEQLGRRVGIKHRY